MGPLAGIRVIDLTTVIMGPFATQALGDMGADVIKVEPPEGDMVRQIGPARHAGMGPMFLNANRNKRSLVLDLKQPEAKAALLRLCETADVLVYNIRPQAMARLGLDYETVAAINPKLIYAGVFGYGQNGPYAPRPAYDDLIQGAALLPMLAARAGDGTPRYAPSAVADRVVGLTAVGVITGALLHRERTGQGQRVDIPMFETMVAFVLGDHLGGLTYDPPLDRGGYSRQLSRDRRPYQTRDGYVCALIYTDKHWRNFFRAIGRETMMDDPRFTTFPARTAHIDEVYAILSDIFLERTSAEWLELLEKADIPAMPMHDFDSIFKDPHLQAVDFFRTIEHPTEGPILSMQPFGQWSESRHEHDRFAPRLGENSVEVLREAGLSTAEIDELLARGITRAPAPLSATETKRSN